MDLHLYYIYAYYTLHVTYYRYLYIYILHMLNIYMYTHTYIYIPKLFNASMGKKTPFSNGKGRSSINGPLSIAMLNSKSVYIYI